MSKANDKKEIDNLLDIVKNQKDETLTYQDDVLQFLEFYNIKSGRQFVKKQTIHQLYFSWSKSPVSPHTLANRLDDVLKVMTKVNPKYYKINQNSMNITKDAFESMAKKKRVNVFDQRRFNTFVSELQLSRGTQYCKGEVLKAIFNHWAKKNKHPRIIDPKRFYVIATLYFNRRKKYNSLTYFGLNKSLKSTYEEIQREETIEKNNKTIKRQTRST